MLCQRSRALRTSCPLLYGGRATLWGYTPRTGQFASHVNLQRSRCARAWTSLLLIRDLWRDHVATRWCTSLPGRRRADRFRAEIEDRHVDCIYCGTRWLDVMAGGLGSVSSNCAGLPRIGTYMASPACTPGAARRLKMNGARTLSQLLEKPIRGRRVFVRADLNVPLRAGVIQDDARIRASLPTLLKLAKAGARVIVASHLGRPKGRVRPELSLRPVADRIRGLAGVRVRFLPCCVGESVETLSMEIEEGEILVLENLRFELGETTNDSTFAHRLARIADVYVFDAFGTAHRSHASTVGMVKFIAEHFIGDLVEREIRRLKPLLTPERPFVCLLGGAKVSSKAHLLEAMIQRADIVAIGGALAYPFLDAKGHSVGRSPLEDGVRDTVESVLSMAEWAGCRLLLPTDHRVVREVGEGLRPQVAKEIGVEQFAVDIGPETAATYCEALVSARSVFWNGPMGIFEIEGAAEGTRKIAEAVSRSPGYTVVGGG